MGFRFRKSKNFGPLRVNVSKSGIGWSIGGKGFRHTKRADGRTQNTYSIPGTGISYINVDSNNNHSSFDSTSSNNLQPKNSNGDGNRKPPKWLMILLALSLYIFSFALFPKVMGALTLIAGLGLLYYLFARSLAFKNRHILIKIFTSIFIVFFTIIFGLGGLFFDASGTTNNKVVQNSTKVDDKVALNDTSKKTNEEEKLKAEKEAQQKAQQEAKLKAEQEAQQKAETEAKLKAEQEAQQKAQEEAKIKAEQEAQQKAQQEAAAIAAQQNPNSNNTNKQTQAPSAQVKVWLSATGSKYHSKNNCGNMNPNKARLVNLDDIRGRYEPCDNCHPPQ